MTAPGPAPGDDLDRIWAGVVDAPDASSQADRRWRWRWLLFALLPTAVFWFALEGILWALGVADAEPTAWSRGFSRAERYLVPDGDGGHATRLFDDPARELRIPPRGDATRVVLFGGSNTAGFPGEHLRQRLADRRGGAPFEVVNLGREGYGSLRVRILLEQALALQPDVVVLYTGHNEFVEHGFALDLERESGGPLETFAGWAAHLRSFRALLAWFARGAGTSSAADAPAPRAWVYEHEKFREQSHAQMVARLETYRDNLRAMCRHARDAGVRVVLCTLIANHWVPPAASAWGPDVSAAARTRVEAILAELPEQLPEGWRPVLGRGPRGLLHASDWRWPERPLDPERVARFLVPPLRPGVGPPELAACEWPPPTIWSDRVLPVPNAFTRLHRREFAPAWRPALERAGELLREARSLAPGHAQVLYELAVVTQALGGDDADVAALLHAAADADSAPRRATPRVNAIVRAVAQEIPGVVLVDVERAFAARGVGGVFGWEWMMDECHVHHGVRRAILDLVADAVLGS